MVSAIVHLAINPVRTGERDDVEEQGELDGRPGHLGQRRGFMPPLIGRRVIMKQVS